jgi:tetratricopeptide (TPR) repeat protein
MADVMTLRDAITTHYADGRFDEGDRLLAEQGAGLPEHVRLECQGNRFFYERKLQEAVHRYEAAIRLAPDYGIARYQYLVGTQDERQQHFVDAFKRYQVAIGVEPTFVDAYVELGGLLVKVGDLAGAVQCYRDAVRLDPTDVGNHHNLRTVLSKLAQAEPERYRDELAAVDAAYEQAAKRPPAKDLRAHRW